MSTLRALIRSGSIPDALITRIGRRRFLSGDQILACLKHFQTTADAPALDSVRRRGRRVAS